MTGGRSAPSGPGSLADDGVTLTEMLVVLVILADRARRHDDALRVRVELAGRPDEPRRRAAGTRGSRSTGCGARSAARRRHRDLDLVAHDHAAGYCQKPARRRRAVHLVRDRRLGAVRARRYAEHVLGHRCEKAESLTSDAIFTYNRATSGPSPATPVLGRLDDGTSACERVRVTRSSTGEISGTVGASRRDGRSNQSRSAGRVPSARRTTSTAATTAHDRGLGVADSTSHDTTWRSRRRDDCSPASSSTARCRRRRSPRSPGLGRRDAGEHEPALHASRRHRAPEQRAVLT